MKGLSKFHYKTFFLRFKSATSEAYSTTYRIFLAMFINTAIITLIVNANFEDFIPAITISNIIPPLHDYMEEFLKSFYIKFLFFNSKLRK